MRSVVLPDGKSMTANISSEGCSADAAARDVRSTTVFVLCGGLGTRLRASVADRPKVLAEVAGRPFLFHLLDRCADQGFERVVLCTGHLGEQVEAAVADGYRSLDIICSHEDSPLDTAGALAQAIDLTNSPDVIVLNGDSVCDVDLAEFWTWCQETEAHAALAAVEVEDASNYGVLDIGDDGQVRAFCEKAEQEGAGWINAGIYYFEREIIDRLPKVPMSLEREVLPKLCRMWASSHHRHTKRLLAWRTAGRFIDIGTPASYAEADAFFAPERAGLLILDRDGTLIEEKHYLSDPDLVELLPGVIEGLRSFQSIGYELAVVTNQSGIGRGYFEESDLEDVNARMVELLEAAGVKISSFHHCPHHPDHGCECRKPAPGMIEAAAKACGYEAKDCLVVGDKDCDIDLGQRVGARTALVRTGYGRKTETDGQCRPDHVVDGISELAQMEASR